MKKLVLAILALVAVSMVAACAETTVKEVPVEVIVEKEIIKEVPVDRIVMQEVVKEVQVPGETVVVEKEVIKEVMVPGETAVITKEVIKEVPVEVVVTQEVVKEVMVPGETVVVERTVEVIKEVPVATFAKFGEAPGLLQLVQSGKLRPVEERLPKEPMVIATQEIGAYGGDFRSFTPSPQVQWAMQLMNKTGFLRWSTDGNTIIPHVASKWEVSDDGKVYTFWLREGMRWSDGAPFTADDVTFQYEDIILDPRITLASEKRGGALFGKIAKVDDFTVTMTFEQPNYLFPQILTQLDTPGLNLPGWQSGIPFSPAHYIKQFIPKHAGGDEALAKRAEAEGFTSWEEMFVERFSTSLNPERPTHRPWVVETSIRAKQYRAVRNAYFSGVDPAGNQLPYIDRLIFDQIPDSGIQSIKALAGEFSLFKINDADLGTFVLNKAKGGYDVYEWKPMGTTEMLVINQSWEGPEAEYMTNKDFRVALSIAIDRGEINEIFFNGKGEIRQPMPPAGHPHYPGGAYAFLHTEYDPDGANEILDQILPNKDSDGFRLMSNGEPLELIITNSPEGGQTNDIAEVVIQDWKDVGIKAELDLIARLLTVSRGNANDCMIGPGSHRGTAFLYSTPQQNAPYSPNGCGDMAPLYTEWFQTKGAEGMEPPPLLKRLQDIIGEGRSAPLAVGDELGRELYRLHAENLWQIGLVGQSPVYRLVKDSMGNVPRDAAEGWPIRSPSNMFPEQWFFRN